jgi:lipoprotein-releasing system permease protein
VNLSAYIARRYLVSKKSHNIINIISVISVAGVTIGTMALIIVLSVFNGFQDLVVSLFNSFNPDLQVTVRTGKTFSTTAIPEEQIRRIPGVRYITEVVEESALMKYKDKQYIITMKGVSDEFKKMSRFDTLVTAGKFMLTDANRDYCIPGYGVAWYLGANLQDYENPLVVYVPRRTGNYAGMMENAFNSEVIFPSGFFSVQEDFDTKYVIFPIRFVRKLLEYDNEVTSLEIGIAKGADAAKIQEEVSRVAGKDYVVKNRFQQQEFLYKIMKSEKWAIFLILTFILFIATFNVIGSLSMLILDKKKDIAVLQCLGASQQLIRKIFLTEGILISLTGAVSGLILGGILCWLQKAFGLIRLGSPESSFVVSSYPVAMQATDFIFVFLTVAAIGLAAALYPVYNIRKIGVSNIYQRS